MAVSQSQRVFVECCPVQTTPATQKALKPRVIGRKEEEAEYAMNKRSGAGVAAKPVAPRAAASRFACQLRTLQYAALPRRRHSPPARFEWLVSSRSGPQVRRFARCLSRLSRGYMLSPGCRHAGYWRACLRRRPPASRPTNARVARE